MRLRQFTGSPEAGSGCAVSAKRRRGLPSLPGPVMAARFGFLEGEGGSADFRPYDSRVLHRIRVMRLRQFTGSPEWLQSCVLSAQRRGLLPPRNRLRAA
jgi:hypothetical protein